jgi:hypothetical protein
MVAFTATSAKFSRARVHVQCSRPQMEARKARSVLIFHLMRRLLYEIVQAANMNPGPQLPQSLPAMSVSQSVSHRRRTKEKDERLANCPLVYQHVDAKHLVTCASKAFGRTKYDLKILASSFDGSGDETSGKGLQPLSNHCKLKPVLGAFIRHKDALDG